MEENLFLWIYFLICCLLLCILRIKKIYDEYTLLHTRYLNIKDALTTEREESKRSYHELESIAYTNPITKLGNIDYFLEHSRKLLEKDSDDCYDLIAFNIMNIGKVNQLFGPTEGDKAVSFAADSLKALASEYNHLYAHVYSNLFCIVTTNLSTEDILELIEQLTHAIHRFSDNLLVEPSFGIYTIQDKHMPVMEMVNSAMLAQKFVKDPTICNYKFYTEELEKSFLENKSMSEEMEIAMAEHKFLMYLQPMVDLRTYKIVSAEALVRWDYPGKGILSPYAFLPLFESTSVMQKLDYYMWEECLKTIRRWIDNKITPTPIAMNISPIHFQSTNFITILDSLVAHFKVDKKLLVLELPERGISNEDSNIVNIVKQLKDSGYILCVDNFGSKSSPLNMLRELPLDKIKVDRSFLNKNSTTEEGLTILRYLIAMAKEMNLDVVTEGIESIEQANFLAEIGCDIAQGYFFSKPIDLKSFDILNKSMVSTIFRSDEYYPTFEDLERDLDLLDLMISRDE